MQVNEHEDRIRAMEDHMKNVRQEFQQTQVLLMLSSRFQVLVKVIAVTI